MLNIDTVSLADITDLPVRVLDRLMVYGEDRGAVHMWSLDCQHNTLGTGPGTASAPPAVIFARGTLKAPETQAAEDAGLQGTQTYSMPAVFRTRFVHYPLNSSLHVHRCSVDARP